MALRLLQHRATDGRRSVIAADGGVAWLVPGVASVRALAFQAIEGGRSLAGMVAELGRGPGIDPAAELAAGRILAPIDHEDPAHLTMSGTGLTHLGSAEGRDRMHRAAAEEATLTDSMRIFLEGLEAESRRPARSAASPNGSTRATARSSSGRGRPSKCRPSRRMAARSRSWPAST